MTKQFFKKLHKGATYPKRSTQYSAGYDLVAIDYTLDRDHNVVIYDTGVGIGEDFPTDMFGDVRARSGVYKKDGWMLNNGAGVVDADYTGTIKLVFICADTDRPLYEIPYLIGDKIGQVVLGQYVTEGEEVDTERTGGFGSTGK